MYEEKVKKTDCDIKKKILDYVQENIKTRGIRSLSIDDISNAVGISKKTFYQYFSTKEDLIALLLRQIERDFDKKTKQWIEKNGFNKIIQYFVNKVKRHSSIGSEPIFIYDLKKYYLREFEQHIENMKQISIDNCYRIVTKGIESGCVKSDLDREAAAYIFAAINQHFMTIYCNNNNDSKLTNLHKTLINIILFGILTPDGEKNFLRNAINDKRKYEKIK